MLQSVIDSIESRCSLFLDKKQMDCLHSILVDCILLENTEDRKLNDDELIKSFLDSKKIEGCSEKTLKYYGSTLSSISKNHPKNLASMDTEDLRSYLADYCEKHGTSNVTINNIRRILSSFYSWLEDENIIIKSPVRRIKKVKTVKIVKQIYSDETLEKLRDGCDNLRDLAMIDLLSSTGMRVGELVNLNREDIDFNNRECVVLGKGNKERIVYFDARTKVHLSNYLESRTDSNPALFITLLKPYERLQISGVEIRLKKIGDSLGLDRVHPHKFRRTLATRAIDKGMPIEQVQTLLGHQKIDTTLEYALVNQQNVKTSHCKFIC
ncbi:site-specific tyrosine recombinase/integron integrase [Methanomethylophilus alvi]|uniref:site-specific tyrosine recombinase/integron integrase n=1 Tax=Methanomethylophilus alvi TaxID=1291540 RepID=UPI0037DBF45A